MIAEDSDRLSVPTSITTQENDVPDQSLGIPSDVSKKADLQQPDVPEFHVTIQPLEAETLAGKFDSRSSDSHLKITKLSRRRRKAADLAFNEKWYCPYGCGKVYRKNSTLSIRKHRKECTFHLNERSGCMPNLTWNNVHISPNAASINYLHTLQLTASLPFLPFYSPFQYTMQTLQTVPSVNRAVQYEHWPTATSSFYPSCPQFPGAYYTFESHYEQRKNYLRDIPSNYVDSRAKYNVPDSFCHSSESQSINYPLIPAPRALPLRSSSPTLPHCIHRPKPLRVTVKPTFLSSLCPARAPI